MTITMKHIPFLMTLLTLPLAGAELDLKTLLEQGLVAEEVNGDLEAAATAYQKLVTEGEAQQRLLATGLFRLAEVRRKQGQSEETVKLLQRLLAEHPAQKELGARAGEILTTLGVTPLKPMTDLAQATLDVEEAKEIARMERLLQESPDRAKKEYPLHLAAEKGWVELARRMIERGFDVNQVYNATGENERRRITPLALASQHGHLDLCRVLIDAKADINKGGIFASEFPVSMAIENNNVAVLELLLAAGALVEKQLQIAIQRPGQSTYLLGTPLHLTCQKGSLEMTRALLTHGAKVDAVTEFKETAGDTKSTRTGQTPLFFAIHATKVIEALLEAGASLEATDDLGRTAVFYAFHFEYPNANGPDSIQDTLSDLIRLGAKVNARDNEGMTPLLYCAQEWRRGQRTWTNLRKLVNDGADPRAVDAGGNGLLHHLIPIEDPGSLSMFGPRVSDETIEWLFSLKLDPLLKNKEGKTALDLVLAHPQENHFLTAYLFSVTVAPEEGLWWYDDQLPLRRIYKPMSPNEPLPDLAQAWMLVRSLEGWQEAKPGMPGRQVILSLQPAGASYALLFLISKANSATTPLESLVRVNKSNVEQAGAWPLKNGTVLYCPPMDFELSLSAKTNLLVSITVRRGEVEKKIDLLADARSDDYANIAYGCYVRVLHEVKAKLMDQTAPILKAKLTRQIDGKPVELIMDLEADDPSNWPRPLTGDVVELLP